MLEYIDETNPGHFFACCGLLELAHRRWPGAQGWFHQDTFVLAEAWDDWVDSLCRCAISRTDEGYVHIGQPFDLILNWWLTADNTLKSLKTWAGGQQPDKIALAAQKTLCERSIMHNSALLNYGHVLLNSNGKPVKPFYFDAKHSTSTNALGTGFSIETTKIKTIAYPAVELLTLVGLQRFHPRPSISSKWSFEYRIWPKPLNAPVAAAVASCAASIQGSKHYRFSINFRDDKKRFKSFGFANQIGDDS